MWNLELSTSQAPIEHTLHAHSRAITDINFSAFHPDMLATCAVDAFVHCWDLRTPTRPVVSFSDWFAGATQVKWNRQDPHIIASTHDKFLRIWDDRKGALPLKTIEAHETKIYGVDWNRTESSKVITCSLDRTIKLWDYEVSETEPERIIDTPFPVWRARHTPFGFGVLAMPQRGNNDLHLYDRREDHAATGTTGDVVPNYSFTGHREQAKEFLWRARGTMENNIDERDFQLITWGSDRELILHRVGQKQLKAVGYHKGMQVEKGLALTRRGAPYKTFRDKPSTQAIAALDEPPPVNGGNLVHYGSSPGMNKAPIPITGGWTERSSMMTYSGMETRNAKQNRDLITWMKGVKFGKRGQSEAERRKSRRLSLITDMRTLEVDGLPENLSDEIIHVGERFTKVTFEEADVSARRVKVSLNGPWASDGKLAFMQLRLDFPQDYPEASPPHFQLEHTSALSEKKFAEIENGLRTIAMGYLVHRRGCLEAILSYLLGERDLQESTDWLTLGENQLEPEEQAESSSDEEDALLGDPGPAESQTLDMEGSMGSGILSANTNVPLPRTCGAIWAPNGRLVCFFPPKEEPKSILQHAAFADSNRLRSGREIFEGFGRLHTQSPDIKMKGKSVEEVADDDDSDDTHSTSSVSSSTSSGGPDMVPSRFRPPAAWHGGSLRFQRMNTISTDGSHPTSNTLSRKPAFFKKKTLLSIHNLDELLPSKRSLAQGYLIFGDGPALCAHNATVASHNELQSLAEIWELIRLVLNNEVPLDILSTVNGQESIPVLAQRAIHRIKRNDSGLDISFDSAKGDQNSQEQALVKWGNHPFAGTWLIQRLFEHFETSADVQMLAMLSCVFAQSGVGRRVDDIFDMEMPTSMKLPAQSLDYFPNRAVALGLGEPTISVVGSPQQERTPGTAFGSAESSRYHNSDPLTPYSIGATPPMPLSRGSTQYPSTAQSLSTSPDQHRVSIPSATSSFAASMWARPFNLASSPPTRQRMSGDDLSTSVPSSSGVTFAKGTKNMYNRSDATIRNSYTQQGLGDEYDDGSTTEEDEPTVVPIPIKLSLKNQALFDDEATANIPFLNTANTTKHICYREAYAHMLGVWGLDMQRNELLKYNGIISSSGGSATAKRQRVDRDSQSTLTLGRFDTSSTATHPPTTTSPEEEGIYGPQIMRCCAKCQNVDSTAFGENLGAKCSKCGHKAGILPCTVCAEPIKGLYKICLWCGHAAHASCLHSLLEAFWEDNEEGELECEAGCGCICEEHAIVDGEDVLAAGEVEVDLVEEYWKGNEGLQQATQNPYFYSRRRSSNVAAARRTLATAHGGDRVRREPILPPFTQSGRRRSYAH